MPQIITGMHDRNGAALAVGSRVIYIGGDARMRGNSGRIRAIQHVPWCQSGRLHARVEKLEHWSAWFSLDDLVKI